MENNKEKTSLKEDKEKAQKLQHTTEEYLESPEALQDQLLKTQEFAAKNKNLITGLLVVFVLAVGGLFFYRYYVETQNKEAQLQLFPAVFYFEKDSIAQALDGDGNFTEGFVAIADKYSLTDAGNTAAFYAGASYLNKGEFDKAIQYLEKFSSSDLLVQARAYCLIGDAYAEKADFDQAIKYYKKAADQAPNEQFTPSYLLKLAFAYEQKGDNAKAKDAYNQLIDTYKNASEAMDAKKYLGRLEVQE